jgi:hypothetical protein
MPAKKKSKPKAAGDECAACRGTGVIVVPNSAHPVSPPSAVYVASDVLELHRHALTLWNHALPDEQFCTDITKPITSITTLDIRTVIRAKATGRKKDERARAPFAWAADQQAYGLTGEPCRAVEGERPRGAEGGA